MTHQSSKFTLALLSLIMIMTGCQSQANTEKEPVVEVEEPVVEETTTPTFIDDSLTLIIGQMTLVGVNGTNADQNKGLLKSIEAGRVGAVVLYEKNIPQSNSKDGFKALISSLQGAAKQHPLIISIDQEGGKVNRLKTKYGFPKMPSAKFLGDMDNLDTTRFYADRTAKVLDELGINVNFAPVLDLCKNKQNPVIYKVDRCFCEEPAKVAKHAAVTLSVYETYNVQGVVKHFPGHGSSQNDSHLGVTDVSRLWGKEELVPFESVIKSGKCNAVMTAHIINHNLTTDSLPATLSSEVNTDLLRKQMGFNGVVFSDDLQMKAISQQFGLKETLYLAINSGVDVLMFSNNIAGVGENTVEEIHRLIRELVEEGRISVERLKESYDRIVAFKARFK